jgi:hypothetical protein
MVVSCSVGTCFDPTEAKVKGTFYSTETGKALAPDSVKLFGIGTGGDSIWVYNKALDLRKAEFPLFAGDTVCKFVIDVNGTSDTIVYSYKSYLKLLSKECGYTYYHTVDTIYYTAHSIDSIAFLKNTVTTLNEENLRIYY